MSDRRILTVTPNAMVARSLSENLHAWGITADTVGSGAAALSAMGQSPGKQHGYDAIIVDDSIEGMTSTEFSVRLKALPQCSNLPLILLGGIAKCLHKEGSDLDGFAACISKPARSTDLHKELGTIFSGEKRIQAVQKHQAYRLQSREAGRKLRVLIVDDNEINRKLARDTG